jgi:hypothetical protein
MLHLKNYCQLADPRRTFPPINDKIKNGEIADEIDELIKTLEVQPHAQQYTPL